MKRYKPLFESEEVNIIETENRRTGMPVLSLRDKFGNVLSELTYSENPNIGYTQDKDAEDFIYIEWLDTPEKFRNKGYASLLLDHLSKKYKHKKIIANMNDLSKNIAKKYGVVMI
jgi:hypothetical protein